MLKLKSLITPSAMLAVLSLAAAPSFAQQKYHGERPSGQQPSGQATGGEQPPGQQPSGESRERAQPRSEAPRAQPQQQEAQRPVPRGDARQEAPRAQPQQHQPTPQQQRQMAVPRPENRGYENRGGDNRGYSNRHDEDNRRRGNVYAPHYEPRYDPRYEPRYSPRGYGYYGSPSYYRPYVFRPRYSLGFGIFSGYPVPYAYGYSSPIWVYGYRAPRERVFVTPGSSYYGGIALEMTPYDADVFVDGTYAGRVEDFDGTTQPLTLTTGVHEIEVQAVGYEPMRMNVEVQPGQIIPFRGDLRPY